MQFSFKKLDPSYLKAAVYGANDGIITTFAVVAGVAGAQLSVSIVLILGIANMIADGFSMGVGDFLGARSEERLRVQQNGNHQERTALWKTGVITFSAFILAGSLPSIPYSLELIGLISIDGQQFWWSITSTLSALFIVGSLRTYFIKGRWWWNGLEMLTIGAVAASVAYVVGAWVKSLVV